MSQEFTQFDVENNNNIQDSNELKICQRKLIVKSFFNGKLVLYFGPQWFLFAVTISIIGIVGIYFIVQNYKHNTIPNFLISVAVTLFELFIYSYTALKDPGIAKDEIQETNEENMCKFCKVRLMKYRVHCPDCNVCIDGHDHHCPWTSKCIGKGNIFQFYTFLVSTSLFFVYNIVFSVHKIFD